MILRITYQRSPCTDVVGNVHSSRVHLVVKRKAPSRQDTALLYREHTPSPSDVYVLVYVGCIQGVYGVFRGVLGVYMV